jgi:hypothetical protein
MLHHDQQRPERSHARSHNFEEHTEKNEFGIKDHAVVPPKYVASIRHSCTRSQFLTVARIFKTTNALSDGNFFHYISFLKFKQTLNHLLLRQASPIQSSAGVG